MAQAILRRPWSAAWGAWASMPDAPGPRLRRRHVAILAAIAGVFSLAGYVGIAWVAADRWLHWESPPMTMSLDSVPLDVEEVTFPSRTGDRLSGWYVEASGTGSADLGCSPEERTLVVLLHGFSDRRESLLAHADFLHQHGCDVLLFDFSGSGTSDGDVRTIGVRAQEDALGALDYAEGRFAGEMPRTVLMGISMGAVVALSVGSDERVDAVVAEAPYSDFSAVFGGWLRGRIGPLAPFVKPLALRLMEWRSEPGVRSLSAVDAATELRATPVFVIENELDGSVPPGSAEAVASAAEDAEHWLVPQSAHGQGLAASAEEYQERVLSFISSAWLDVSEVA